MTTLFAALDIAIADVLFMVDQVKRWFELINSPRLRKLVRNKYV